jgi:hypothetical protein
MLLVGITLYKMVTTIDDIMVGNCPEDIVLRFREGLLMELLVL